MNTVLYIILEAQNEYVNTYFPPRALTVGDESDEVEEVRVPAAIDVEREVQQGDAGTSNEGNARRW